MSDSSFAISTNKLRKEYGDVVALNDLSVDIPYGAIGLLGPNGAGKSTLLKILLGLAPATSGSALLLGGDIIEHGIEVRKRVGYMPENDCLPDSTTAADFVGHMAEMSGLPTKEARQRAADVLYQVGMDEERYRLIKGFSTGMKQRVKLAQSIVHDPLILFLDEPTAGLDPQGREEMLDLIRKIHRQLGMTVVLSSHILDDIERVCDFVVILDHGDLKLAQGMADRERERALRIEFDGEAGRFIGKLTGVGLSVRQIESGVAGRSTVVIDQADDAAFDAVRDSAADLEIPLRKLSQRAKSLEDLYLASVGVTGKEE